MNEQRPKFNQDIALAAAKALTVDLVKEGLVEANAEEESARDIARVARRHMDGYEIAKELDSRCYWGCDLQLAEALDGFGSFVRAELERLEREWAERNAIAPTLEVGTRVRIAPRGEFGRIDGVYKYGAAQYLVEMDGETGNSRRIVNFEDAAAVEAVEAGERP